MRQFTTDFLAFGRPVFCSSVDEPSQCNCPPVRFATTLAKYSRHPRFQRFDGLPRLVRCHRSRGERTG